MHHDPYTSTARFRCCHHEIGGRFDIHFIRLEKRHVRTIGTEQDSESQTQLRISQTESERVGLISNEHLEIQDCLACLLHSQAVAGALGKWHEIPVHEGIIIPEPAIRNELERFGEYSGVGMHQI